MKAKYIPVILWALCILLATNNYNFQSLLFAQEIGFNIRLLPDLSDLLITSDIHLDSGTYVFQKIGHALSFGVLFLILAKTINNNALAIILCSLFAFFTEFLQLFFERSGRLSDVLIDIGGIYLAYRLSVYVKALGGVSPAFWNAVQKIAGRFEDGKPR
ncbi:VanZ family protein [Planomicrobium stackebrandtii]|uniref:VanZ family protein n=1 Tax=Planomicrobium stackebrandtii TaxID=253160 RepID=A0ABU0GU04_9BACL|nr:VanZ family protein [Planomicrobium stackebrandtii]MDQ0428832.1 VanZ family protein [Planomicrobium stackebrandtii]